MITFLRHGRPTPDNVILGQIDVPLDHYYTYNIKILSQLLKSENIKFDRVICSPMLRCKQTATMLGYEFDLDPRIKEIYLGSLQEKVPDKEIKNYYLSLDDNPLANRHQGETFEAFKRRVENFYTSLNGENILVVTHSGVIRTIATNLLKIKDKNFIPAYMGALSIDHGKLISLFGR